MIAAIFAAGAAAVAWTFARQSARTRSEHVLRLSLAGLAGAGLASAASGAAWLLGLPPAQGQFAAVLIGIAALARHGARGLRLAMTGTRRPVPPWVSLAFGAALVLVLGLLAEHLVRYPDGGWDARAIWSLRARHLFFDARRAAFAPELGLNHPDYPLLLPQLVADGFRAAGGLSPWAHALPAFVFAALLVALLASGATVLTTPATGLLAGLALLGTPALLQLSLTECADVPLAAFLLGAVVLLHWRDDFRALVLAGCLASLGAWTKNEGLLYLLALAVALAASRRRVASFLLGALPVLALLLCFKLKVAPPNDLAGDTTAREVLRRLAEPLRWAAIGRALVSRLWLFESWGLAVPAAALLLAARRRAGFAGHALLLLLAVIVAIYLATPRDLVEHMRTSLDRLLFQLAPCLLLAAALRLPGADPAAAGQQAPLSGDGRADGLRPARPDS